MSAVSDGESGDLSGVYGDLSVGVSVGVSGGVFVDQEILMREAVVIERADQFCPAKPGQKEPVATDCGVAPRDDPAVSTKIEVDLVPPNNRWIGQALGHFLKLIDAGTVHYHDRLLPICDRRP